MKKKKREAHVEFNDNNAEELPHTQVVEPTSTIFHYRSKKRDQIGKNQKIKKINNTLLPYNVGLQQKDIQKLHSRLAGQKN